MTNRNTGETVKLQFQDWWKFAAAFLTLMGCVINFHIDTSIRLKVTEAQVLRLEKSVERLSDKIDELREQRQ